MALVSGTQQRGAFFMVDGVNVIIVHQRASFVEPILHFILITSEWRLQRTVYAFSIEWHKFHHLKVLVTGRVEQHAHPRVPSILYWIIKGLLCLQAKRGEAVWAFTWTRELALSHSSSGNLVEMGNYTGNYFFVRSHFWEKAVKSWIAREPFSPGWSISTSVPVINEGGGRTLYLQNEGGLRFLLFRERRKKRGPAYEWSHNSP